MFTDSIVSLVKKKAMKSSCRYRIGAVGISEDGRVLKATFNKPKFFWQGGGIHAEREIMRTCGKNLKSILICRVNPNGKLLPIHPCKMCKKIANDLNINIYSVLEVV